MAQRVLSISLGSEVVKVCEVCLAGKKKVQIFNAIDLMVPNGLCEDGVIQNVEALASVILDGLQGEGFTAKKIVFSISSKRIANKEAVIPFCKENRIADIVKINAAEYFPIANIEEYVYNYSILEILQNEGVKNYRLSVIATPKDLIADYHALAVAMGMTVHSIDYSGNSILQVLKLQTAGAEVDAILQMSMENTVVNIMSGQTLVMQRSVPYGRASIVDAVKLSRNVPDSVADMVLMQEDIRELVETNRDISEAVRALFSSINRIIEFYSNRYPQNPISNIYMLGDVMSVLGLVELFDSEWTDRNVSLLGTLNGIEIKDQTRINEQIAANYLANIGALLSPMKISLTGEKEGKNKSSGLPWWLLIVSGVISVIMCASVLTLYFIEKSERDAIQSEIDSIGSFENLEEKFLKSQSNLSIMESWYDSTKDANESLARFLTDLESVQPKGISITQLSATNGELSINGNSESKQAIAEYIKQLKKLDYVENVKLNSISEMIEDYITVDSFSISVVLVYKDPHESESEEETSDLEDLSMQDDYIEDMFENLEIDDSDDESAQNIIEENDVEDEDEEENI